MINVDCDYYESAVSVFNFIEPFIQHGTVIYLDDVFAGFTENSNGGVYKAFQEFKIKSNFNHISHMKLVGGEVIYSKELRMSEKT